MKQNNDSVKKNTTPDSNKDAGLALALILIIIALFSTPTKLIFMASVILVFAMTIPKVFKPFAIVWFGLSHLLGDISTKLILTILFFLILTPIGLIRRLSGSDPLQLTGWPKDAASAFSHENHLYGASDITSPY